MEHEVQIIMATTQGAHSRDHRPDYGAGFEGEKRPRTEITGLAVQAGVQAGGWLPVEEHISDLPTLRCVMCPEPDFFQLY